MREFEKHLCEYVILGSPCRPLLFFMNFLIKKGARPTVYTKELPFKIKALGLARFCRYFAPSCDDTLLEILSRHASLYTSKKCVLIYTPYYGGFIERNRLKLEKDFLILSSEDIYAS